MSDAGIRIGCAGWAIASRQAALFGEGDSTLARYATRLSIAEINSTFHRSHRPDTYVRWAATVPRSFRFSVKLPKAITHEARLVRSGPAIATFAEEIAGLGPKLGGVLVQLPPSLALDARLAGTFFRQLRGTFDAPIACEPRHASWFEPRVDALWARHDIARVRADPPKPEGAASPGEVGGWRYFRLHGAPRIGVSETAAAVDQRRDRGFSRHDGLGAHVDPPGTPALVVARDHRDPVRVDAVQVGPAHDLGRADGGRLGHAPGPQDQFKLAAMGLIGCGHRALPWVRRRELTHAHRRAVALLKLCAG